VIGGLLLASLLTLFVIPVVYTYADDATDSVLRGWERLMRRWTPRRPGPPTGGDGAGRVPAEEEPRVPIGGRR
jgi:hypothetical protein